MIRNRLRFMLRSVPIVRAPVRRSNLRLVSLLVITSLYS